MMIKPSEIIGPQTDPYMLRWHILRVRKLPRVYVHKFLRSDDDRALHDHPWWYCSILLRGGYVELTETDDYKVAALCRTSIFDVRSPFRSRAIVTRSSTHRHRVVLPHVMDNGNKVETPCWTLFITGPVVRKWGFWCPRYREKIVEYGFGRMGRSLVRSGSRFVLAGEFDGCA